MNRKNLFIILSISILILGLSTSIYFYVNKNKKLKTAHGSDNSTEISETLEWDLGTYDEDDISTDGGSVALDNLTGSGEIDLAGKTTSASVNHSHSNNVTDGDFGTYWEYYNITDTQYWQVDLGETISGINQIKVYIAYDGWSIDFQGSTDGAIFSNINATLDPAVEEYMGTMRYIYDFDTEYDFRYIKINVGLSPCPPPQMCGDDIEIHEVELFYTGGKTATHTSGATQIDGGETFFEWETFTPSQSVPEDTTLTYRFRSSTDGSDWGSWSGYQTYSGSPIDISELVTSRDGGDKYRYLQVESKFTSADGVSTPTLSDYTIGYHINRAPNTPTAATAVIAD